MSSSNRITVAVRVRPLNRKELSEASQCIVSMSGPTTMIKDPDNRAKHHAFSFDHCLWSALPEDPTYVNQEKVFERLGKPLLASSFQGFHTCLLAYGQTGSGKTYSVIGYHHQRQTPSPSSERGLMPRLCQSVFDECTARTNESWVSKVELSYFEIYCERCRCLLNPTATDLKVREHPVTGPFLDNLTSIIVHSAAEVLKLMDEGNRMRTVTSTAMNTTSSRSHAIFTLKLSQRRKINEGTAWGDVVSHMSLVDLAGSERAKKSGLEGKTLQEGTNINRSLATLGKVIFALADTDQRGGGSGHHIPYRESMLTWLLKETLGGNSKTTMLATVSPAAMNYEETLSTLRYADNAKRIVTRAFVNEDPQVRKVRQLQEEIDRLRVLLNKQIVTTQSIGHGPADSHGADSTGASYEAMSFVKRLEVTQKMLLDVQTENELSWDEHEQRNAALQLERAAALHDIGASCRAEGTTTALACLINLHEDSFLSGCLVYPLEGHRVMVGSRVKETSRDIILTGPDIMSRHAILNKASSQASSVWTIRAAAENALVYVNGKLVTKGLVETPLSAGDRVIFGYRHVFRYRPAEAGLAQAPPLVATTTSPQNEEGAASEWERALLERHEAEKLSMVSMEHNSSQVDRLTKMINNITQDAATTFTLAQAQRKVANVGRASSEVVHRWRLLLIGHEEVGKTSLRKCFLSDPYFFKRLPDVTATVGIERQSHNIRVNEQGDTVTLDIHDFAGQESYHSHSLFLAPRSVYVFVWKMSAVGAGQGNRGNRHGMGEFEYARMTQWLDEVYAKCSGSISNVSVALVGTHLDELRDQNVSRVQVLLLAVRSQVEEYLQGITIASQSVLEVIGNFACSCKERRVIAEHDTIFPANSKMSLLLLFFARVSFQRSCQDKTYRDGLVPGSHALAMRDFEKVFCTQPGTSSLIIRNEQYCNFFAGYSIPEQDIVKIMTVQHCCNALYVPNLIPGVKSNSPIFFLQPLWLGRMVACLYSFAHVLRTPMEIRVYLSKLDYDIREAILADRGAFKLGMMSFPLARTLFQSALSSLRGPPHEDEWVVVDGDVAICLQVLETLDVICAIPKKERMYYVPRLFPDAVPPIVRRLVPRLFRFGVCRLYQCTVLPRDFLSRLFCRLLPHVVVVEIPLPAPMPSECDESELVREASFRRSLWRDGIYVGDEEGGRALVLALEGMLYAYASTAASYALVEAHLRPLLGTYPGMGVTMCCPCRSPTCDNWFDEGMLRDHMMTKHPVTCQLCEATFPASDILMSDPSVLLCSPGDPSPVRLVSKQQREDVDMLETTLRSFMEKAEVDQLLEYVGLLPPVVAPENQESIRTPQRSSFGDIGPAAKAIDHFIRIAMFKQILT